MKPGRATAVLSSLRRSACRAERKSAWEATTVPTCRVNSLSVKTITPVLQAVPFTSRQAGSDDKEFESLGNEIENAQSNHLTPLSRAVAPPVLKRRENRKMGEERGIEK